MICGFIREVIALMQLRSGIYTSKYSWSQIIDCVMPENPKKQLEDLMTISASWNSQFIYHFIMWHSCIIWGVIAAKIKFGILSCFYYYCKLFWSTMTDGRLSSLSIFFIHKHKDFDIDDVIIEFAHLKGWRLALCL